MIWKKIKILDHDGGGGQVSSERKLWQITPFILYLNTLKFLCNLGMSGWGGGYSFSY